MPTERFAIPGGAWSADSRITAAADTAVSIVNTTTQPVYWALTDNDTPPALEVSEAEPVEVLTRDRLSLKTSERLWIAARSQNCQITVTTGAM